MALTTAERTNIIKLVVGMFNAAPGATYLSELTTAFEANGRSLSNLAKDLALTPAYRAINQNFQTAAEFATSFLTPLGLQANAIAVDFVTAKFNAGVSKGQIAYEAIVALDASTAAEFADAKAIVNNKTTVAEYYSVTKAISQTNVGTLQQVVSTVTKDAATVTAANAAVDSSGVANAGSTLVFTNTIDNLQGTSGNDTFVGDPTFATAADQVNGGGGTDTIKLVGDIKVVPSLTSVEVVQVVGTSSDLSVSAIAGVTSLTVDGALASKAFTINGATQSLTLQNETAGRTYDATTGATDAALTMTVNGLGKVGTASTVNVVGAALKTLNVATSTANSVVTLAGTQLTTLNVTGDKQVILDTATHTLTKIDASKATGNVLVTNSKDAGMTFTGGTGNDYIGFGATQFDVSDVVNGGTGTDTLALADVTVDATTTALNKQINAATAFETVLFNAAAATAVTRGVITNATITKIAFDLGAANTATVTDAVAADTYAIGGNPTSATSAVKSFTITPKLGENALTVSFEGNVAAVADTSTGGLTINGNLGQINIASSGAGKGANTIGALTVADNAKVVFTGANAITNTGVTLATGNTGVTLDATAMTGAATLVASGKGDIIKGGTGKDTITGGLGADVITLGAGADTFVVAGGASGPGAAISNGTVDTITDLVLGAGGDILKVGAGGAAGVVKTLTATQLTTVAAAADLTAAATAAIAAMGDGAKAVATFGFGTDTYLIYNAAAATAAYDGATDFVIKVTGVTGALAADNLNIA